MAAAGFPSLSNTRYEDLIRDVNPNTTIVWCQAHGLISKVEVTQQGCNNMMTMANRSSKDGKTWRCQQSCRKTLKSIHSGTFFEASNPPIYTILKFTHWAYELLDYTGKTLV